MPRWPWMDHSPEYSSACTHCLGGQSLYVYKYILIWWYSPCINSPHDLGVILSDSSSVNNMTLTVCAQTIHGLNFRSSEHHPQKVNLRIIQASVAKS